jgi:hypothetical protein
MSEALETKLFPAWHHKPLVGSERMSIDDIGSWSEWYARLFGLAPLAEGVITGIHSNLLYGRHQWWGNPLYGVIYYYSISGPQGAYERSLQTAHGIGPVYAGWFAHALTDALPLRGYNPWRVFRDQIDLFKVGKRTRQEEEQYGYHMPLPHYPARVLRSAREWAYSHHGPKDIDSPCPLA